MPQMSMHTEHNPALLGHAPKQKTCLCGLPTAFGQLQSTGKEWPSLTKSADALVHATMLHHKYLHNGKASS